MPAISIITVNLNNASGLRKTIQSVVNQTYDDYEYIIIDGGSIDGSTELIKEYSDKITFWASEPDKGIYDGMNKGIISSTGDLLFFLNSGDTLSDNNILNDVYNLFINNPDFDIYYGKIKAVGEKTSFVTGRNLTIEDFKLGCLPDHQATFIRRDLFATLGLYNISYKIYADYDFMYKCLVKHKKFFHFDKVVSIYLLGGTSSNDNSYLFLVLKYFGLFSFLKTYYLRRINIKLHKLTI